jgi:hypothetical protein
MHQMTQKFNTYISYYIQRNQSLPRFRYFYYPSIDRRKCNDPCQFSVVLINRFCLTTQITTKITEDLLKMSNWKTLQLWSLLESYVLSILFPVIMRMLVMMVIVFLEWMQFDSYVMWWWRLLAIRKHQELCKRNQLCHQRLWIVSFIELSSL